MANVSVNFDTLKGKHPNYQHIRSMIGGELGRFMVGKETCAVQVSYALNHSAAVIEAFSFADPSLHGGKVRALESNDGFFYIFGVPDMKVYLNNRYGLAENYKGSKNTMIENIKGRRGILAFGHRHIDLWEGERFHWQQLYRDLWGFDSVKVRGVFFWEVTSEWGF